MVFNKANNILKIFLLNRQFSRSFLTSGLYKNSFINSLSIKRLQHTENNGANSASNFNTDDNKEHHNQFENKQSLNEDQIRKKILESSLKFVHEVGFTNDALSKGSIEAGYSAAAKGMFENGAFDLIDYFYKKSNTETSEYLENIVKEGKIKSKNELIRLALVYRLGLIQPYITHWPQAMAIQTFNPNHALKSIENLLRLCDEIWHEVGDNSTDLNWYSKRLTLAALYKSTEVFMIQDKSENFKDTNEFLNNRFKDVAKFDGIKREVNFLKETFIGSLKVIDELKKL